MGRKNIKLMVIIWLIVITSLATTYALIELSDSTTIASNEAGCFEVNYTGQVINGTTIQSTTTYTEGTTSEVTLSKNENCEIYTEAEIKIHTDDTTTAPITENQALKYKVEKINGDGMILNGGEGLINQMGDLTLATVSLTETDTTYKVYIWIDSEISLGSYDNKSYSGYIYATSIQTSTVTADNNKLNEYGFYYDKYYTATVEEDGQSIIMSIMFSSDGSAQMYYNGELAESAPAGTFSYEIGEVYMDGELWGTFSSNGTIFNIDDLELHLDSGTNEYGFYYDRKYTATVEEDGQSIIMSIMFSLDGSAQMYYNGELAESVPAGSFSYEIGEVYMDGELCGTFSSNGTIFNSDGLEFHLEVEGELPPIQFNKTYGAFSEDGDIEFVFSEDGTCTSNIIYADCTWVYSSNVISTLLSSGDESFRFAFNIINNGIFISDSTLNAVLRVDYLDVVEDDDYEYYWVNEKGYYGWRAFVKDKTKSSYSEFTEIDGYPVVYLKDTFEGCTNLVTAPVIPNTVIDMTDTFKGCTNLVTAPVIPNTVAEMRGTFEGCTSLRGEVEINTSSAYCYLTFFGTTQPITITGSSSIETKAALAATANNGNVTY